MPKKWLTFTFLLCTTIGAFFVPEPARAGALLRMDIHTIPTPTQAQLTAKGRLYYFCLLDIPTARTVADHGTGQTVREISGVGFVQKPLTNDRGCDKEIPFEKTSAVAWITPDGQRIMRTVERDEHDLPVYDTGRPRWVYWQIRQHKKPPSQDPSPPQPEMSNDPVIPGYNQDQFTEVDYQAAPPEDQIRLEAQRQKVTWLYQEMLGRTPAEDEQDDIDRHITNSGGDMQQIAARIRESEEYLNRHPELIGTAETGRVSATIGQLLDQNPELKATRPKPRLPAGVKRVKKRLNLTHLKGEQVATAMRRSPVGYPKGWHPILTGMVIQRPHVCDLVVLRPKRQSALDRMGYIVDFGCNGQPMRRLKIHRPPYGPFCGRDSVVHLDTELGELIFPLSKNPCENGVKVPTLGGVKVVPYD